MIARIKEGLKIVGFILLMPVMIPLTLAGLFDKALMEDNHYE